jgi:hypothetical protein
MNTYLYLLPFKNSDHFKIGISAKNFTRIFHLNNIYDFDLEQALIVTSENSKIIKILERELLSVFSTQIEEFKGMEGGTEIRDKTYWHQTIDLIESKNKYVNIAVQKFKVLPKPIEKTKKIFCRTKNKHFEEIRFLLDIEDFKNSFEAIMDNIEMILFEDKDKTFTIFLQDIDYDDFDIHFRSFRLSSIGFGFYGINYANAGKESRTLEFDLWFDTLFQEKSPATKSKYSTILLDIYNAIYSLYLEIKLENTEKEYILKEKKFLSQKRSQQKYFRDYILKHNLKII